MPIAFSHRTSDGVTRAGFRQEIGIVLFFFVGRCAADDQRPDGEGDQNASGHSQTGQDQGKKMSRA
jgi:hypothetical protein